MAGFATTWENAVTDQQTADALADAAVAPVEDGMVVGLGSGRTASRGVIALAKRLKEHQMRDVRCVCTSHTTETLARFHSLPVTDFAEVREVDYLFDGADAFDHDLRML